MTVTCSPADCHGDWDQLLSSMGVPDYLPWVYRIL